ncbi:protein FAM13C-like isoform X2 [Amphiprion ocellaris]|uniref:FAM13A-like domain-containing protein n=1 Tax=Amphiprion ocellaris TaxID=80972 RepID=A0AAQ5ZMR4_AMPOC|nr:protein FAM13C-like isoform X2 [Amphiprion ocellaris]
MFCFCLQSSLLKLQALEVEGGPSLGPSPEDSPPALGSKEQKSPGVPPELGGKDGKTLVQCHSVPSDENSPPELLAVLTRPPQSPRHQPLTSIQPGQQPLIPDSVLPPSPHHSPSYPQRGSPGGDGGGEGPDGGGGGSGGGGALLQLLAGGPSPLPSPRCSSHSLRFNSDPDSAPSPPCSQQYMLCRGRVDRTEEPEDHCPPSIPFLTRHIQTLKKKVRRFEDQFELEMNYKPSHNDKYSNPEMVRVMGELAKARKQLKELRLRQSVFESKESENTDICRYSSGLQGASEHKPTLEETVESLFRRLREKRQALGLPDNMKEMTQAQMVLEKITLQKCLLYFESLHGRPGTKQEKSLVKPLYDRYQMIKHLLCSSPAISTIEEEDGSDEDSVADELPVPPPRRATRLAAGEEDSDRDSDPAFVSPIDEVKAVRQHAALTTANLHEASRSQLLDCLRETRAEKKTRRKVLREFEDEFYRQTGRICQKEDRSPMKDEYQDYKQLKAKLRLLEVLLSKQDVSKPM